MAEAFFQLVLLTAVLCAAVGTAHAQAQDVPAYTIRTIAGTGEDGGLGELSELTGTRTLHSKEVGQTYTLSLYLPDGYADAARSYPVLYALDGDASFDELAACARQKLGLDLIVVGIGYGIGLPERRQYRLRDYTPESVEGLSGTGGGDAFLGFVEDELVPYIETTVRADPDRRIFAGHSLGGFFVLHALFTRPALFQHYIAISPSVAIDDFGEARRRFALPEGSAATLFLGVGGSEDEPRMLQPFHAFAAAVGEAAYEGLGVETIILPGEDHATVVLPGLDKALAVLDLEGQTDAEAERVERVRLDGWISDEEWGNASRYDLVGGGEALLMWDGGDLYIAVRGDAFGWSHAYVLQGDTVLVLHASAALGTAAYRRTGTSRWDRFADFEWALRDTTFTSKAEAARAAFFEEHGWIANTNMMGSGQVIEFRIAGDLAGAHELRLAVVFASHPEDPLFWPSVLNDGTLDGGLIAGRAPERLDFAPASWTGLESPR